MEAKFHTNRTLVVIEWFQPARAERPIEEAYLGQTTIGTRSPAPYCWNMEAPIEVRIAHSILRQTVEDQARAYLHSFDGPPSDLHVLISTTGDLTPAQAGRLVAAGTAVIILATMPAGPEQRAYVAAGAHYVPMSPAESRWTDSLQQALLGHGARAI